MRWIIYSVVVLAALTMAATAQAQPLGEWEVLGESRTRPGVESLTIDVPGRRAGRFDALKVAVRGGNVLLLSVEVEFENGDRQKEQIRFPLTAGSETGPIRLQGGGRFIRSIKVRYGSLGFLGRPTVVVLGHPVRARERPPIGFRDLGPRWERVGIERVSRERERDVIQLSRRDGRYDAILLRVRQSPVRIRRVSVVFGNGERQDFDLPRVLRRGDETDILELRGRRGRFIDRIVLVYRDIGGPRPARMEVFARQAERRPEFRDLGPDWSRLATERVSREPTRDVIQLSRRDGRFDALLLRVRQSPVRIRRVSVIFGNGQRQDFDLRGVLRRGADSGVLELRGRRGRFIDRIVLVYRDAGGPRRARVEVWGREVKRRNADGFRPLGPRWDEIGIMKASRGGDRDLIEMSRRDGRFDALLLRVRRNNVEFRRVRVVYGNGREDNVDVERRIRAGEESDVLELRGARGRFLDLIELVYRTRGGGRQAIVEVWGRKSLRR